MALQVLLDGRDVTAQASSLTFSSVDPGGYEACSFTLPPGWPQPAPGAPIRILEGLEVAWEGEVEDPGPHQTQGRVQDQVQGVGHGVKLKDDPRQCIYVDRDISRWQTPISTTRRIALNAGGYQFTDAQATPDTTNGLPSLALTGELTGSKTRCEALYDAGPGLVAATFYYDYVSSNALGGDPDWALVFTSSNTDDESGTIESTADLAATPAAVGQYTPVTARRYFVIAFGYETATTSPGDRLVAVRDLTVYGDHGLTRHGAGSGGLFAEDIAVHALAGTGIDAGAVDASGFIVLHSVYRDPTLPEQTIDDMSKLTGFHWGVWESLSLTDDTPRLDFRARPSTATAIVSREDCEGLQLSERRSQLYDTCIVTYQDAAGVAGQATVKIANPRLPAGVSRTLGPFNMGIADQANATDYATAALELAQAGQRGGGPFTLPVDVKLPGGGSKPAHLLKAGLDRLKITDLPDSGPWTDLDTRRFDTFRVKRVETSVQNGVPRTTGEVDEGADLLEVLNARHAIAQTITGA